MPASQAPFNSPPGGEFFAPRVVSSEIPLAWKALAALCYLGPVLFPPLLICIAVGLVFAKSRYLRGHAFAAGIVQAAALALTALLKLPSYLFLITFDQYSVTPEQILGAVFTGLAADPFSAALVCGILALAFLAVFAMPAAGAAGRGSVLRAGRDQALPAALWGGALAIVLFLVQRSLGGNPHDPGGLSEDPYKLFPGFLVLHFGAMQTLLAVRGMSWFPGPLQAAYVRFDRAVRSTGEARARFALRLAKLAPGLGQFAAGQRLGGFVTLLSFGLLALFAWTSLLLNYGRLAEETTGLNPNAGWYFLGQLGLRAYLLDDRAFRAVFGQPLALGLLLGGLALFFLYSCYATRMLLGRTKRSRPWLLTLAHSLLLHAAPLAMLLLVPVTILPTPPQPQNQSRSATQAEDPQRVPEATPENQELEFFIPENFSSEEDLPLNGAGNPGEGGEEEAVAARSANARSSEERPRQDRSQERRQTQRPAEQRPRREGPGSRPETYPRDVTPDERETPQAAETDDAAPGEEELLSSAEAERIGEGQIEGERRRQTYSNYLSVKIRSNEKQFDYWERMPQPYAAVFQYRISPEGRVYDVRVLEASNHKQADQLTVRLIESMGTVLPPPGGEGAEVTELFWNTAPGDQNLPTPQMRALSEQFDGRVIKPLK